ncbi:hypothetical protein [Sphingomonas sp.]|jgi:hypothetical protein|uniref:hypothetical protein n=1 Tax=Sphingomonas sp. TaxID=28214 RepID=UPI002D8067F4|nr:hypothetical protein [Sphingomonas sp.]HEU0043046.1 hypothetical protein [Sphingomonas sp.]
MRIAAALVLAGLLAGCVGKPVVVAVVPAPAPVLVEAPPPAPTPINAGLSEAATLWHLRAGLNVAALACRGSEEAITVARYNALLARNAAALKAAEAAYAAEYQAKGGAWRDRYDDEMTRLYNFFGQAQGREAFCEAARVALAELETAPDPAIGAAARLASLDRPFAPPWLPVDPRIFGGPVRLAAR